MLIGYYLVHLDNATLSKFDHGDPHPIGDFFVDVRSVSGSYTLALYQEHGSGVEEGGINGRSWYTSLGHVSETWLVRPWSVST